MIHLIVLLSIGTNSVEKIGILGIAALFAGAVYIVMPKALDKKLRKYHEPLESDEEDDVEEIETEEQNQGETK